MEKLNCKTDIQVVNLIEREVTKSGPLYITPQHPCIFPYDIFFKAMSLSRTQETNQLTKLTCAISLETGLGKSREGNRMA